MFRETRIGSNKNVARNSQTNALQRCLLSLALGKRRLDRDLLFLLNLSLTTPFP